MVAIVAQKKTLRQTKDRGATRLLPLPMTRSCGKSSLAAGVNGIRCRRIVPTAVARRGRVFQFLLTLLGLAIWQRERVGRLFVGECLLGAFAVCGGCGVVVDDSAIELAGFVRPAVDRTLPFEISIA